MDEPIRLLIAEDDPISRRLLETTLGRRGYELVLASDGRQAWDALHGPDAPPIAILDWMMPEMNGIEICAAVRAEKLALPPYLILLTARGRKEDVVEGLNAGADDYITKPFNSAELVARLRVGARVQRLQAEVARRMSELEDALANVKTLQGLLPICSYCKDIRDDQNYWHQVDAYFSEHSNAQFTHGICPKCYEGIISPMIEEQRRKIEEEGKLEGS